MRGALARLGGRLAAPPPHLARRGCALPGRSYARAVPPPTAPTASARDAAESAAAAAAAAADADALFSPAPPAPSTSLPTEVVGRVMSAQANFVRVRVDGPPGEASTSSASSPLGTNPLAPLPTHLPRTDLLCIVRGLLKKMKQTVLVGDRVTVGAIDWADGRGAVTGVLPRTGGATLADPAVANVDQVVCVFALARPPFEPKAASRFLVAAEAAAAMAPGGGARVVVVLNKADLVPPDALAAITAQVAAWGYHPVPTAVGPEAGGMDTEREWYGSGGPSSAPASVGLAPLRALLAGRLSVLAGPSGVGKSSLINALHADVAAALDAATAGEDGDDGDDGADLAGTAPGPSPAAALLAVGGVSRAGRGRHTTRHVSLIPLPGPGGGAVADTPGFNQPDLEKTGIPPTAFAALFPEVRARLGGCAFADCSHAGEPGCALVGGLGAGAGGGDGAGPPADPTPPWPRHAWYLEWRAELEAAAKLATSRSAGKAAREGAVRYKSGSGGVAVAEARLDPKKNRRVSRRAGKKVVADLLAEEEI